MSVTRTIWLLVVVIVAVFFYFFAGGGKEGVMLARLQLFESSIKFFSMLQEFAPLLLK